MIIASLHDVADVCSCFDGFRSFENPNSASFRIHQAIEEKKRRFTFSIILQHQKRKVFNRDGQVKKKGTLFPKVGINFLQQFTQAIHFVSGFTRRGSA